ncbi:CCNJL protein, partial [Galbula dea]|nr:CCNJL protein [Galbula dea]
VGRKRMDDERWIEDDVHNALRAKELVLPIYKACSPQLGLRRHFVRLLVFLSNSCELCLTAQHLAIYLLDFLMDHYDISVMQLNFISFVCLTLASKFEEKRVRIPRLQHLNYLARICGIDVVLNKKDMLEMELQLLQELRWCINIPTPAHYISYYLSVSVSEKDLYNGWPIPSLTGFKELVQKYAYYFLEISVQDHNFLHFRPSLIAAASVCASRTCMEIFPPWTKDLASLTHYSFADIAQCTNMMLRLYVNDIEEADNIQKVTIQHQNQEAGGNLSHQVTTQAVFQQSNYNPLGQHSNTSSHFHSAVQDLCAAYRESLQACRSTGQLADRASGSQDSCADSQGSLWPSGHSLPIQ